MAKVYNPTHLEGYFRNYRLNTLDPATARVQVAGIHVTQLHAFLQNRTVAEPRTLLHEIYHGQLNGTGLGAVLFFVQHSYLKKSKMLSKDTVDVEMALRSRFCQMLLQPIEEGLCCFVQFDYLPSLDPLAAPFNPIDQLYFALADWQNIDDYLSYTLTSTLSDININAKYQLLLSDLATPSDHIRGYLWIKDLYHKYRLANPNRASKPEFLGLVTDFIFADTELAFLVLDAQYAFEEFAAAFSCRLCEKLTELRTSLANLLNLFREDPEQRPWARRDRQFKLKQLLIEYTSEHLPDGAIASVIDKDTMSLQNIVLHAQLGRVIVRFLSLSVHVKPSDDDEKIRICPFRPLSSA
jgi:hypothetical protein